MLNVGFATEIITPKRGVGLAGYFNKRPNCGVLDDLYVKVVLFEKDGIKSGIVSFDLCGCGVILERLKYALLAEGKDYAENLIICATHTHTGPGINDETAAPIIEKAMMAIRRAEENLAPGSLCYGSIEKNPCGFVRRYWMKDGSVVTNPGKLNPNIVKPECDFDRKINVIGIKQEGRLAALMVNLAQHGDTIGGNFVSADWMGLISDEIHKAIGENIPVLTIMNASGDINHFDVTSDCNQTYYGEAKRISKIYADIVMEVVPKLEDIPECEITVKNSTFQYNSRTVSEEEVKEAQHILDTLPDTNTAGDLTSEGLASGDNTVLRHFAKRIVDCATKSIPFRVCRVTAIEFGKELVFASLPGEPFNGISRAIQEKSPFKRTVVIALAQSQASYTPMPECFERGGYETKPGVNTSAIDNAPRMIQAVLDNF